MSDYVTRAAWTSTAGRRDAIDDVADQFEHPVYDGASAFWTDESPGWPRRSRSWRWKNRIHGRAVERRAG